MGRTLGNVWPPEPRLFTHSRELWMYNIEEMSVKIGIKFFGYKEVVRVCLVWDLQNANYIAQAIWNKTNVLTNGRSWVKCISNRFNIIRDMCKHFLL